MSIYTLTNRCVRTATRPSLSESFLAIPLLHSFCLLCTPFCIKKQMFAEEVFGKIIKLHIFGTKSQNGSVMAMKYGLETRCGSVYESTPAPALSIVGLYSRSSREGAIGIFRYIANYGQTCIHPLSSTSHPVQNCIGLRELQFLEG